MCVCFMARMLSRSRTALCGADRGPSVTFVALAAPALGGSTEHDVRIGARVALAWGRMAP